MTIYARMDDQGAVLDFIDWHGDAPITANMRLATSAEITAITPVASYRDLRAVAYRDQLGKETGDYIKTLGDVLDTLIAEMAALAAAANVTTPEFSALLKKIQAVKAAFPKA